MTILYDHLIIINNKRNLKKPYDIKLIFVMLHLMLTSRGADNVKLSSEQKYITILG